MLKEKYIIKNKKGTEVLLRIECWQINRYHVQKGPYGHFLAV